MGDELEREMPMPPREEAEEFYSRYELGEIIGQGTAVVRHCTHIETGQEYAVKIIDKTEDPESTKHVIAEIDFLKKLDYHPHIIRLNDSFQTESHFFLVFELARCGELFELLTEKVFLPEDVARHWHVCVGTGCMLIGAGGLQLENILLMEEDTLKISDFGFAAYVPENENLYELCGTPGYLAPEMIRSAMHRGDDTGTKGYRYRVDMWACGVILYTILVGFPPFWNSNRMVLMRLIMRGKFEFLSPYWDSVSDEAKDLVARLLSVNPAQRLTASEALLHPWMQPVAMQIAPPGAHLLRTMVYVVLAANRFVRLLAASRGRPTPMALDTPAAAPVPPVAAVAAATAAAVSATAVAMTMDAPQVPTAMPRQPTQPPSALAPQPQQQEYAGPSSVTDSMYADSRVRKAIDECAFRIYGHWVKKSNAQNRAALFENYLIRHI